MADIRFSRVLAVILLLPQLAAATTMSDIICSIMGPIFTTLFAAGGTLVVIMFIYGGIKYVYASDDPGGRKEAKNICIHTLVAGILMVVAVSAVRLLGATFITYICPSIRASTGL
ncbi:MAG: hypothetical protein V1875_02600 [Candidatus Altiarchaeota archaeon]